MLTIRLAKSKMENEEGMNHVWIQITPPPSYHLKNARLTLHLPPEVYRLENLNGYFEDEKGVILLGSVIQQEEIMIEIYTQQEVPLQKTQITASLSYKDKQNQLVQVTSSIPLQLVAENEMDDAAIDEEVVSRLKKLSEANAYEGMSVQPIQIQYIASQLSDLEKKYRIDGALY
ncbi:hypothetical protein PP175_22745 [Aneurinibacillus sp. Ricciae_BoGa-3]|uniref:hypothetical protein n=1 Tax=Aneurinibacillus sp. Ricciae_BoGa-3 TaxID=3022697 RepID=UPI00233FCD9D|nr:hypothetical protein [Aneurinibacillus sp. Ricciae_BoGa-3]WCK54093.1 hypothetical protein PP175_22745 [Aneurinibacillus sp. Ricciae_BoGa-3]